MTIFSTHLGGHGPFGLPLATHMAMGTSLMGAQNLLGKNQNL